MILFIYLFFLLNSLEFFKEIKNLHFFKFPRETPFYFFLPFFCSYKALEPLIATCLILTWLLDAWETWKPVLEMTVDAAGQHIILD